jgi:hypothetical protein
MISDEPSGSPRVASLVLDSQAITGTGSGARIFRAVTERDPVCIFAAYSSCLSQILVIDALWTGDEETVTAPITAPSLMGALALGFSNVDFLALEEIPAICPIAWPAQTYVGSTAGLLYSEPPGLPVRLVLFFGSTAERQAAAPQIRRTAQALAGLSPSAWCRAIPSGISRDDHWVVRDNVMLLLGSRDATTASIVDAALSVAQQLSAN